MLALTKKTGYGLIAMGHLAALKDGEVASAGAIAKLFGVPQALLMNVLKELAAAGFVQSVRGAGGGYRLARRPRDIRLAELTIAVERPVRLAECVTNAAGDKGCSREMMARCPVGDPVHRFHRKLNDFLQTVTLAEILNPLTAADGVSRGEGVSPLRPAVRGEGVPPLRPAVRGEGVSPLRPVGVSPASVSSSFASSVASSSSSSSPATCETAAEETEAIQKRQGHYVPHWTKAGDSCAVTFRLADSLPPHILQGWMRERDDILQRAKKQGRRLTAHEDRELDRLYSIRVEAFLDSGHGDCHLAKPGIAGMIQDALLHFDGERYELIAWCIMPNHVHVIVKPLGNNTLAGILHAWKSFTAKQANRKLGRTGALWQEEHYDHLIRDEEDFNHHMNYLLGNPEKAGLRGWEWVGTQKKKRTQEEEREEEKEEGRGRDAHGTQGRDALATNSGTQGQDALATEEETRGQDARGTQGRDALAAKGHVR